MTHMKIYYFIPFFSLFLLSCGGIEPSNLADPAISFPKPSELTINRVNETTLTLRWEYGYIGEEGFKVEQNNGQDDSWNLLRDHIPYDKNEKYKVEIINLPSGRYKFRVCAYFRQRNSEYIEIPWQQLDYPQININNDNKPITTNDSVTCVYFSTTDAASSYKEKGVCWGGSNNSFPTITEKHFLKMDVDSIGISRLGLEPYTGYYLRTYVTNYIDTVYSRESKSLSIKEGHPVVVTSEPKEITKMSARLGGSVSNDGGYPVSELGIYYGTNPDTTQMKKISMNKTVLAFDTLITNLSGGSTYYVLAYATNVGGTGAGTMLSFETSPATVPKVKTLDIEDITYGSAICSGEIEDEGGSEIGQYGICYSINPNPTMNDKVVYATSGIGVFTVNLTGLTGSTSYYVKAFARNAVGTALGEEKQFKTLAPVEPVIETKGINNIGSRSAKVNTTIISDGGSAIVQSGVCWSTNNDPTITQNMGITTNGPLTIGDFTHSVAGLTDNTEYYVRYYVKSQSGLTGYGASMKFTTQTPWRQIDDFPGTARNSVISFSINNIGYVGLGTDAMPDSNTGKTWYDDLWAFDGSIWKQKASIAGARDAAVSFTIGTDAYVGLGWGGSNIYSDWWKYNTETNIWSKMADFTGEPRGRSAAFSLQEKGYVATGAIDNGTRKNDVYKYIPDTDNGTWEKIASLPNALLQVEGAVAFTIGNKSYLGLGYNGSYNTDVTDDRNDTKIFYEYNPTTDLWTKTDNFPGNARNSAVAFVIGNKAYVGLGWNGQNYLDFYQFDPTASTGKKWTKMCNFRGDARGRAAVFVIHNKAYIGLGTHDSDQPTLKDFWEYDPSIDY